MLDNPVHKERAVGLTALAAIGLGGAMAVDVLVTGGFDFGPGRAAYDRQQPSAYVRVVNAAQYVRTGFSSVGEYFQRPPDTSHSEERLAGADDGSAPPDMAASDAAGDNLYREIAALYADSEDGYRDEPAYEDAPATDADEAYAQETYEEPAYEDEYSDDGYAEPSASESESPW
jgi:hypothetical protein